MKFNTFYEIYYSHRVKKSSFLLKLYIFITLPINYLINKIKLQSIINLDNFANKNQNLFEKDLKFLFEFFNSDKGEKFINQYLKPIKLKNNLIDGHLYHNFYEQYLRERKQERLKILELGSTLIPSGDAPKKSVLSSFMQPKSSTLVLYLSS